MSALPKQVQKQVDEANSILDQINAPPPELDAEGKPIEPPAAPAPVEPAAAVEPAPHAAPEPAPEPAAADDPAEHKYKVLQGKYNAEVPKLNRELKEARGQIGDMQQRLTNTESLLASMQHVATPPRREPAVLDDLPIVTEDETLQFGADLESYIERVAARKILPEVESRIAPVATRVDGLDQNASQAAHDVAVSERDRVMLDLANAVPEWEKQNENEDFLKWLNSNDPYAGVPRGQLLTNAFRQNDSTRVIAFFKGFQTENAVVTPEPIVTPSVSTTEPQQTLDNLVAPGTPKTGTTSAPDVSGKRVWTQQDISAFYAKKNTFVVKGIKIPDEYEALERDLFAAQHEGRIR